MLNLITYSTCQNTDSHRGFGSSLWGQVSQVGSQWLKSVQNSVDEIGKVASVLAGDATDAVNTVSKLRVVSSESEATPSATPFFKRAYKISHPP